MSTASFIPLNILVPAGDRHVLARPGFTVCGADLLVPLVDSVLDEPARTTGGQKSAIIVSSAPPPKCHSETSPPP
jgi:hypothetical protein